MADAVVSLVVERIGELLINTVADEIGLLTGVKTEVRKLESNFQMIRGVLDDAEQKMIKDINVRVWLEELEDICYEMDAILDEWNTIILKRQLKEDDLARTLEKKNNVSSFISSSFSSLKRVGRRRDIAIKIRKLNDRFNSVIEEMKQFKFVTNTLDLSSSSQDWKRVSSTSMVDVSKVQGRVSDLNILIQKLVGESSSNDDASGVKVMSIVGLGGIGKTTLAQLVFNDSRVKGHFEQQIWVCVSDPFEEIQVTRAIIQSLQKDAPNLDELDPLLSEINRLTARRRFILVLDDVWTEDYTKFEPFLNALKDGSHGSMILLTTRSVGVARVFESTYMHKVQILEEWESWSLFCQIAFSGENGNKREELQGYGKEIIKKCKGLPLAIKMIASLLRFKSSTDEWRMIVSSNIWDLEIAELQLFPHLYLSYKNLSAPLKQCFTFCAVFPKDKPIIVTELINIWMAEGYLGGLSNEDNIDIEAKGREYFDTLARPSFFQGFHKKVKFCFEETIIKCEMHDIVHDFAQYLKKRKCRKTIGSKYPRHVFFYHKGPFQNKTYTLKINGHPRGVFANGLKMERLSLDLLSSLSSVRELRLSWCKLTSIQSAIEKLIHLRYLDLSYNDDLKELPTTSSNLCNLLTLDISFSRISCLPQGSEKLISLRHLIFQGNEFFSLEGVKKLTIMQSLVGTVYINELCWLKNLNQLGGNLRISMENNSDADTNMAELRSKYHLQLLHIDCKRGTLEALDLPPNLQLLSVEHLFEAKFPTLMMSKVVNLKRLDISFMYNLSSLPPFGKLPVLEKLVIRFLNELKFVGRSFLGLEASEEGASFGFPKLKELDISVARMWEKWEDITREEEDDTTLPIMSRLQILRLNDCRKLKALPHRLLRKASSLEIIELDEIEYSLPEVLSKPRKWKWWLQ